MVLAVGTVLVGPVLVSGAETTPASSGATVSAVPAQVSNYETVSEAASVLGFTPKLPSDLPEEYRLAAIRTLDGGILEIEYQSNENVLFYRTALGANDLSLLGNTQLTFTLTEEDGAVVRSYAGESEDSLYVAVWAQDDASYAIVSEQALAQEEMQNISQSIA